MKAIILCLFLSSYPLLLLAQQDSLGFTNKAEAKNLMINGKKEGKWVEYLDSAFRQSSDPDAPFYSLVIYRYGEPNGMRRTFYKSGKIEQETPFVSGKINGIEKSYYENGVLENEHPYANDKENINGFYIVYYDNGQLAEKVHYTNGKVTDTVKVYYKNGNLMRTSEYEDGLQIDMQSYDENGNEIK